MDVLVASLPTKGTFAIWAIEIKGRVYPAKLLHLARAYRGFSKHEATTPPPGWDPSPSQGYSLCIAFPSTGYTLE